MYGCLYVFLNWQLKYCVLLGIMSGSCHLDTSSNVEIGVECQIFVIVIFFLTLLSFTIWVTFKADSEYYKGTLTKKRSLLVLCITFRSDFHID
jgi:hypothetical protein